MLVLLKPEPKYLYFSGQGDSLSPLLFNIVMNEIIKYLKGLQGYPLGDENVNMVCYADDATLVADNEDDLQRLSPRVP